MLALSLSFSLFVVRLRSDNPIQLAGVSQAPAVISAFVYFVSLKEADVPEKGKVLHVEMRKTNTNPKKVILLNALILDHLVR